jgi:[acyl-carrier-protein] S-malonyltransferase
MTVALLFSPQGSQTVGMGRELADASPAARAVYAEADAVLGWEVSRLCWHGPEEALNDTRQTQPCLVATSLACLAALREQVELQPAFVAGHSVGEYAALVAAGALRLSDALQLVSRRGELMAAAGGEGGMLAVIGLDRETVGTAVSGVAHPTTLVVANDNAPDQVVVSGTRQALEAVSASLRDAGARRLVPLRVSGAFHSPLMSAVTDALAEAFHTVEWSDPGPPVVSNVTAEPVAAAGLLRNLLAEQVRSPVEWVRSVRRMAHDGVDTFVECGPGSALTGMVRRIVPAARTLNVSDAASLASTRAALSGSRTAAGASR